MDHTSSDLEIILLGRAGRRKGREIAFCCPVHDDKDPSCYFNIDKRVWNCQGCGAKGGENALRELLGLPVERRDGPPVDGWPPGIPRIMGGAQVRLYTYKDVNDAVIGYIARSDPPGEKIIRQFFIKNSGQWSGKAAAVPRPLYGLHRLKKYPEAPVWIVEGEKCVDALISIRVLALTSPGGSGAAKKADWTPLAGRKVIIWPDNDGPGRKYAQGVASILRGLDCDVSMLPVADLGLGDGGDCADWLRDGYRGKADVEALPVKQVTTAKAPKPKKEKITMPDRGEWTARLTYNDKGLPKMTSGNLLLIFLNDPAWKGVLGFDERSQTIVFRKAPPEDISAKAGDVFADRHVVETTIWLQDVHRIELRSTSIVFSTMVTAANACSFDPVKEWFESLPDWDGIARADAWLPMLCGCNDNVYTQAVGSKTLISAVARVFEPGCKVDTVMVLHGPQGALKSSLLEELAGRPEWFTDHISDIGGKDAAMQLCGPWIVEFSELDAITGKRESERVKAWITQRTDRFRPPYGRSVVNIPRRVIFTGTSNLSQFLRDETGGRRFLPVEIREIDLNGIREHREQLWAEALHRYRAGERWWLEGEALDAAKIEQEDRRVADPWEAYIVEWLQNTEIKLSGGAQTHNSTGRRVFTTSREILTDCLKMEMARAGKAEQDRCGRILGGVLGWRRGKRRVEGIVTSVWYPPLQEEDVIDMTVTATVADAEGTNGY